MVLGPEWTVDNCRAVLRFLRKTETEFQGDWDREELESDVLVSAKLFHEVLTESPTAARWPLFANTSRRPSLFKATVRYAVDREELSALVRLSDQSSLLAANIARWMLQLPQQSSSTIVFSTPPAPRVPVRHAAVAALAS
jgi:hypothetical protein